MSDPEAIADYGGEVVRKQFIEVMESLVLNPRNTHSIYMDPDGVHATEYLLDETGSLQSHPEISTVLTREVFYNFSDAL
jgi:predicted RNA-binding protein with EMAP domain